MRVDEQINRSNLLQNIRDFFTSKGSKLGIKSLFKIIFGETDVEVNYPGDRMIKPSTSTWAVSSILRVAPMPLLLNDNTRSAILPDKIIGAEVLFRSWGDDYIYGRALSEYVSSYPINSQIQYDIRIAASGAEYGDFVSPNTTLTRTLEPIGVNNDEFDVYTVTVSSTNGFPDSGIIFVGTEGIKYTSKSSNQFFGCTRGYVNVIKQHNIGDAVFSQYYIEAIVTDKHGVEYSSRSWPVAIVEDVTIIDPGFLHSVGDKFIAGKPGNIDPEDYVLATIQENISDDLATQENTSNLGIVQDTTYGVSDVYYNDEVVS